jgi:hypothetical protein
MSLEKAEVELKEADTAKKSVLDEQVRPAPSLRRVFARISPRCE